MAKARAYIGLGSNLDDPVTQVTTALQELGAIADTRCIARSGLYQSTAMIAMGAADQPDYINAVAALDTGLAPMQLLEALQAIEQRHGRTRNGEKWGPRTLDLDLLLYENRQLATEHLIIPHPGLHERNFVLYPLAELAPDIDIPGRGPLPDLLSRCGREGLVRLEQ